MSIHCAGLACNNKPFDSAISRGQKCEVCNEE